MKYARALFCIGMILLETSGFTLFGQSALEKKRPTVALVLEGGSAYGFAHIGVIKVIEEMGIPVDIVVGTSMGSIVGGLYSIGYTASDLEDIAEKVDWTDMFLENSGNASVSYRELTDRARYTAGVRFDGKGIALSGGLISGNKILRYMDSLTVNVPSPVDFDSLPRRFRAVATDVETGKRVVFSEGALSDAMRASMSIPGVFDPYYLDGKYFIDGGVVENLPVDIAREMGADIIIAVDLYDGKKFDPEVLNRSPILSLSRTLEILTRANVLQQLAQADLVIPVNIQGFLPTDFAKAKDFAILGEKTARDKNSELAEIRTRVLGERNAEKITEKEIGPVAEIIAEGGKDNDRALVKNLCAPLVGTVPDIAHLQNIFSALDDSGIYQAVRVRRDANAAGNPLVISLVRKPPPKHEIKLGFLYQTTVSTSAVGNLDIVPAVIFHGLTTEGSQLRVEGEMLDTPDIAISFVQPVGKFFSFVPFYSYERDATTRLTNSAVSIQYQTASQKTGFSVNLYPARGIEWSVGWHYDWIILQYLPDGLDGIEVNSASLLDSHMAIHRLDSPIFPMSGISALVSARLALTELGSERYFAVLQTQGSTFLSLNTPFSVAFMWKAGTDFSTNASSVKAAPSFYKPDLGDRRMFPGPLLSEEQIGSHVAGIGLEIKNNLNWNSKGITIPVFVIVHAAIGASIRDPARTNWVTDVFHGNATAGIGLRVSDAFGVAFRVGVHRNMNNKYIPFIALDLGSIGL